MDGLALLLILVALFFLLAPAISIVWLFRLSARVERLTALVAELERRLALPVPVAPVVPVAPAPAPPDEPAAKPAPAPAPDPEPAPAAPDADPAPPPAPRPAPATAGPWAARSAAEPAPAPDATPPGPSWEERLAGGWMVWLGGATVALAAVFLFRWSVEQGWLTPFARVLGGLLLGGALLAAGEAAERAPARISTMRLPTDYVPPALSAAGIFAILVSLFAAHALYGLMGPGAAFTAMALTVWSALALSLRQGWFVALLGIVAGYLVPLLVSADAPAAAPTFLYLFTLTLGALGLMVWRNWAWFSLLAIAGALLWPVFWTAAAWRPGDEMVLGLYAVGLAAAFGALSTRLPLPEYGVALERWLVNVLRDSAGLGFTLSGVLLIHLAVVADYSAASFLFLVLYAAVALALGVWRARLESLLALSALVAVAALLIWPGPAFVSAPEDLATLGLDDMTRAWGPFEIPPELAPFAWALAGFGAVFGAGGFAALGRVVAKPAWAGISSFLPVILLGIGYWRIADFQVEPGWSALAAGLAVLLLGAATTAARALAPPERDTCLGLYAGGVTAALALALACLLREAWLTVALAAEVAALGWIWSILRVRALKAVAVAVLAVVVLRLVFNPFVLDYAGGIGPFGWVLYGYGLPALAAFAASRLFLPGGRGLTVTLAETAALGLAALGVAAQLRLWTGGALDAVGWSFLDIAVQAVWWILAGVLVLHRRFAGARPWAVVAGLGAVGAGTVAVVLLLVIVRSPLVEEVWLGRWPVVNLLGLAYLLPAILLGVLAAGSRFAVPAMARGVFRAASGGLVFAALTLEVRRAVWGPVIAVTPERGVTTGELYAYSAVWILFAFALLGLGLLRGSQALRHAALGVLLLTVAKVFLYDMSGLEGLYRVASFLGLGLALIGIGRLYRVFVMRTAPEPRSEPAA